MGYQPLFFSTSCEQSRVPALGIEPDRHNNRNKASRDYPLQILLFYVVILYNSTRVRLLKTEKIRKAKFFS